MLNPDDFEGLMSCSATAQQIIRLQTDQIEGLFDAGDGESPSMVMRGMRSRVWKYLGSLWISHLFCDISHTMSRERLRRPVRSRSESSLKVKMRKSSQWRGLWASFRLFLAVFCSFELQTIIFFLLTYGFRPIVPKHEARPSSIRALDTKSAWGSCRGEKTRLA